MSEVTIIGAIIIGALAGWTAEKITHRRNPLFLNLLVAVGVGAFYGIAVAFLSAFIANAVSSGLAGFWSALIVSAVSALVLLAIWATPNRRSV